MPKNVCKVLNTVLFLGVIAAVILQAKCTPSPSQSKVSPNTAQIRGVAYLSADAKEKEATSAQAPENALPVATTLTRQAGIKCREFVHKLPRFLDR